MPDEPVLTYWYYAIALFGAAMTPYEVFFFSSGAVEEQWPVQSLGQSRLNVLVGFPLGGLLSLAIAGCGAVVLLRPVPVQGAITKTGNGHARRLLVEAAWHHRKTYRNPGQTMRTRWGLAPVQARVRGHQGNQRLHQRWEGFIARRNKPVIANVVVAGELAGWAWSLAVME